MWTLDQYVGWALVTLVSAFIGSYLAGYLKKKGENLATHEDINKVLDQVKAVTEATKKIEAEISVGVWAKQKRWEMKREVLFEAAKRLSEAEDGLLSYASIIQIEKMNQEAWATAAPSQAEKLNLAESKVESARNWSKVSNAFDESRLFVAIVCGKDAIGAFEDLGRFMNGLAVQIPKAPDAYQSSRPELIKKVLTARNAIRKELEVDT